MATWEEFAASDAAMAEAGGRLLSIGIAYLATTRKNGWPRVHPVTPVIGAGRVFVAMRPSSPKSWDLERTGRYALHALPGENDEEFMCYGPAVPCGDAESRAACRRAANHTIHDDDLLFELRLDAALHGHWERVGQPDTYPVRRWWSANA